MTTPEFEALVSRLEIYAARAPRSYQMRVALLACLGYACLYFLLAVLLAMIGGIAAAVVLTKDPLLLVKLLIGPLALAATLVRSLKVLIPEPEGLQIEGTDAPHLFALLDALRAELKAPPFHRVLLTREMNAAVAQVPRFGLFGGQRNFLILGLPLMQALTPEQFKAVVAHEVGHLSGNHARFSGWIHRVRLTWLQVLENLHQGKHRRAAAWVHRFFAWYAPYFSAYSFVLARQNEYAADKCAAEVAGAPAMAQALVAAGVRHRFCEDHFWPEVQKQVEREPLPPPVFTALAAALQRPLLPEQAQGFIQHALREKTGTTDTHPSLTHRLQALGCRSDLEEMLPQAEWGAGRDAAAASLFGPSLPRLQDRLEQEWQQRVSSNWQQSHRRIHEGRQALAALDALAQSRTLTGEESWDQACATLEFGDALVAVALFQRIAAARPDHAETQMALGRLLAEQCDPTSIAHLEAAMRIEPGLTLTACQVAFDFCKRQGRDAEAEEFHERAAARRRLLAMAQAERESVGGNARFEAHDLPPAAVADLARQLTGCRDIKAAYLVRKKVKHLPEHPLYVLWLVPPPLQVCSHQAIASRIAPQIKFPKQMRVLVTDGSDLRLLKIRRAKDAQIWRRGR